MSGQTPLIDRVIELEATVKALRAEVRKLQAEVGLRPSEAQKPPEPQPEPQPAPTPPASVSDW